MERQVWESLVNLVLVKPDKDMGNFRIQVYNNFSLLRKTY